MKRLYIYGLVFTFFFLYCDNSICVGELPSSEILVIDWEGIARDGSGKVVDDIGSSKAHYVLYPLTMRNKIPTWSCGKLEKRLGPFTVNKDGGQVYFSGGNLQYKADPSETHQCADKSIKQGVWRFAEHQWDYVGNLLAGNVYMGSTKCSNTLLSNDYAGWIDLFCWATSGWKPSDDNVTNYEPWSKPDTCFSNYCGFGPSDFTNLEGDFVYSDWGIYNQIGEESAGSWHCLSIEEWEYLIFNRIDADSLYSRGTVNGVLGLILLPDEWHLPSGVSFIAKASDYTINNYTEAQWEAMEQNNAVFLPLAGVLTPVAPYGTVDVGNLQGWEGMSSPGGYYWSISANPDDISEALLVKINPTTIETGRFFRSFGCSVRLVIDK